MQYLIIEWPTKKPLEKSKGPRSGKAWNLT